MAGAGEQVRLFTNGMVVFVGISFVLFLAVNQFITIGQTLSDNVADLYARGPAVQVAVVTALDFVP